MSLYYVIHPFNKEKYSFFLSFHNAARIQGLGGGLLNMGVASPNLPSIHVGVLRLLHSLSRIVIFSRSIPTFLSKGPRRCSSLRMEPISRYNSPLTSIIFFSICSILPSTLFTTIPKAHNSDTKLLQPLPYTNPKISFP